MARRFSVKHQTGFTTIAMVCFFLLYLPIAVLVVFAFNAGETLAAWRGLSLRWFWQAFQNTQVIDASIVSLQIATVAAVIATVAATMAALATTRTEAYRGLTFKYAFINTPLMVPEIVTAVALLILFSRLKIWTGYTGLGYLIAAHTAFCLPFAYLPIRARLENMDLTLERAAADLYATPFKTFRYVTFPLLWPGILAGWMLAFVTSLDDVVITEFVKSAGQDTLPTYMLGQIRRVITPEMNAISTVFLLLSIAAVTVFFFVSKKRG
ncbi:ABC transporter permease [Rhizobium sp. RAF56]|uniref:ABC transporter permease n=1 Tax=Rhizobium sp. RAF56 TaxID=3233062 RepID=UPI003F986BEE